MADTQKLVGIKNFDDLEQRLRKLEALTEDLRRQVKSLSHDVEDVDRRTLKTLSKLRSSE